jgi:AcrR family transcriptional regulator
MFQYVFLYMIYYTGSMAIRPGRARADSTTDGGGKSRLETAPTLRLERRLTPSQAARRDRLREAARELASEGGYAAVTMRSVAERAGVGLATVYRYFSSKDHLIAEVHAAQSQQLIAGLRANPPRGASAADRVAAVFARMFEVTAENLDLSAAGVAAVTSGDPAASAPEYWQSAVIAPYLDAAFGDEDVGDRAALGEILGHLFFSLMVAMTAGHLDAAAATEVTRRAAQLMLGARTGTPAGNRRRTASRA